MNPTPERYEEYLKITDEMNKKIDTIYGDSAHHSLHLYILDHPDFKALVKLGDRIIPYIFHSMITKGCTWVHILLLGEITNMTSVQETSRGKFYNIVSDWLGWYITSPYNDRDDIYHGLLGENQDEPNDKDSTTSTEQAANAEETKGA